MKLSYVKDIDAIHAKGKMWSLWITYYIRDKGTLLIRHKNIKTIRIPLPFSNKGILVTLFLYRHIKGIDFKASLSKGA